MYNYKAVFKETNCLYKLSPLSPASSFHNCAYGGDLSSWKHWLSLDTTFRVWLKTIITQLVSASTSSQVSRESSPLLFCFPLFGSKLIFLEGFYLDLMSLW